MNGMRTITFCMLIMVALTTWANAPIVDLSQPKQPTNQQPSQGNQSNQAQSSQKGLLNFNKSPAKHQYVSRDASDKQQLTRLRNKMNNLVQMNLPGQIEQIKQKIQDLQGRLDTLEHRLDKVQRRQQQLGQALNKQAQSSAGTQANNASQHSDSGQQQTSNQSSDSKTKVESAYRQAFLALHQQKYDSAKEQFESFIKQHPDTPYTAGAYYWLGELYYVKGNAKKAKEALNTVLNQFSDSEKVPAAKLKLALIALDEGDKQSAQKQMQQIKQHYPDSSAAKLAKRYLKQMNSS